MDSDRSRGVVVPPGMSWTGDVRCIVLIGDDCCLVEVTSSRAAATAVPGDAEAQVDFVAEMDHELFSEWFGGRVRFSELLQRARRFQGSLFACVCATGLLLEPDSTMPTQDPLERWPSSVTEALFP